jgi:hypothetical protein
MPTSKTLKIGFCGEEIWLESLAGKSSSQSNCVCMLSQQLIILCPHLLIFIYSLLCSKKKLRDHYEGALAKISRNIPIGDDRKEVVDGHDFQYDVDLVLGGKLTKLDRTDLEYTTAEAEGMIGDNRARRKRKPEQTEEDPSTTSTTEKPKPQKKASGKQAKAAAKGAGKKRKAGEAGKGAGSKKSKSAAVDVSAASISANAMDMYERHRREFERSIGRLEKTDQYDFFYGDVPPEFDETYGSRKVDFEEVLSTGNMKETQSNDQSQSTESNAPEKPQNENEIIFPESPAYNFHILRKRMEHGRYVLDLDFHDRNERYELMLPYYNSVGRRISKPKKKKKPSSHILHHTAVNWDLFRKDLVEMCDAAIARNPDENTPNESGTLGHTVVKIKEAMDQIYEKTAQRHILEMTTANDRHRFTLALKEKENASAAMQGKWRRHGKFGIYFAHYLTTNYMDFHKSTHSFLFCLSAQHIPKESTSGSGLTLYALAFRNLMNALLCTS